MARLYISLMQDALFLVLTLVLFLAAVRYVHGCDEV